MHHFLCLLTYFQYLFTSLPKHFHFLNNIIEQVHVSPNSDRFRTTVNVWGDCIGAGVVQRLCREQLDKIDSEEKNKTEEESGDTSSSALNDTVVTVPTSTHL